jgi:predicted phosphodiesterase
MERIALLSDLHGNVTAFEAVLADLHSRGITTIYNLGDVVGKGPRGSECVRLSRKHCTITVRGNWDDLLPIEDSPERDEAGWWWHRELSAEDRDWLRTLPLAHDFELSGRRIRAFHASADSLYTHIQPNLSAPEFDAMFANTTLTGFGPEPSVICYGDIHAAFLSGIEGRTLINVGSVGNPLDELTAGYVILEGTIGGKPADPFSVQFVRVPYDVEAEIAVATTLGMPALEAYAIELRTGIFRREHEARGLI